MFRTEFIPFSSEVKVTLRDKILTAGSCFSDAIGHRLSVCKFKVLVNPFGVAYNPHSIHKVLLYALHNLVVPEHTYLKNQEIHLNYDFHSKFSSLHKPELENALKETIGSVHYFLKDCRWLIITYGTSWIYTRKDTGDPVANCHKMPGNHFQKDLMTQKKAIESFEAFYKELKSFNPGIQIMLTVSPVRHVRDTLELNTVSKSVLRLTCHTLAELYPDIHYFPAFEIMMDDLRDYRFYKTDLIHPSEEAEDYIWAKFSEAWFDVSTREFLKKWKSIQQALTHKPFHPTAPAHQKFIQDTLKQLEELNSLVNTEQEINQLKAQLL